MHPLLMYALYGAGFVGYVAAASLTFGYIRGVLDEHSRYNGTSDGWETPIPLFGSVMWPVSLPFIVLRTMITSLAGWSFKYHQRQLEKRKQRIEVQEKLRVQIEEAEQEIERQLAELEDEMTEDMGMPKKRRKKS